MFKLALIAIGVGIISGTIAWLLAHALYYGIYRILKSYNKGSNKYPRGDGF
jgi:hypothetical protein